MLNNLNQSEMQPELKKHWTDFRNDTIGISELRLGCAFWVKAHQDLYHPFPEPIKPHEAEEYDTLTDTDRKVLDPEIRARMKECKLKWMEERQSVRARNKGMKDKLEEHNEVLGGGLEETIGRYN